MLSVVYRRISCLRQSVSLCSEMTCAPRPNPLKAIICSCVSPHRVRISPVVKHILSIKATRLYDSNIVIHECSCLELLFSHLDQMHVEL